MIAYVQMFGLPSDSDVVADGLSDAVVELAGSRNVLDARLVELIGQVWASGAWEGWGLRSIHHWVTLRCGVSPAQARTLVGCARRFPELPATRARFAAGELSVDQVAVITRVVPTHADAEVAELAGGLAVPQLRNLLGGYAWPIPPPDPDAVPDTGPVEEERRVGFGYGDDGTWSLTVRLPGDEGAVIEAALGAKRDQLWQAADDKADREQITRAGPAPPDHSPDWIAPPSNWTPPTGEPIHTKWVDFTHPTDWAV